MSDESNLALSLADFLSALPGLRAPVVGISPEYASNDFHAGVTPQSCGWYRSRYQLRQPAVAHCATFVRPLAVGQLVMMRGRILTKRSFQRDDCRPIEWICR